MSTCAELFSLKTQKEQEKLSHEQARDTAESARNYDQNDANWLQHQADQFYALFTDHHNEWYALGCNQDQPEPLRTTCMYLCAEWSQYYSLYNEKSCYAHYAQNAADAHAATRDSEQSIVDSLAGQLGDIESALVSQDCYRE